MSKNLTDFPLFRPEPSPTPTPTSRRYKFLDLTDQWFGRLRVLYYVGQNGRAHRWFCECKCGKTRVVATNKLRGGLAASCGCWHPPRQKQTKFYPVDPNIVEQKCKRCEETKPASEFSPRSSRRTGLETVCRACRRIYFKRYVKTHPEYRKKNEQRRKLTRVRYRKTEWSARLKAMYGITQDDYDAMLAAQGGVCKICGLLPERKEYLRKDKRKSRSMLGVDHCHTTGKVRGIICQYCNLGIGGFKDNPDVMLKAIAYLKAASESS